MLIWVRQVNWPYFDCAWHDSNPFDFCAVNVPTQEIVPPAAQSATTSSSTTPSTATNASSSTSSNSSCSSESSATSSASMSTGTGSASNARPGSMVRVPETSTATVPTISNPTATTTRHTTGHSRNSSWDQRTTYGANGSNRNAQNWNTTAHSRTASLDLRHSRNSSVDLNKMIRNDVGLVFNSQQNYGWYDPLRVQIIKAHHNWISTAYPHFVTCYRLKDSSGWQLVFTSPYIDATIERLAIKANFVNTNEKNQSKMVAISYGSQIRLWRVTDDGTKVDIGIFNLNVRVEYLFFIGNQLVALSPSGKIGVWHSTSQHWQIQDLCPISSFDTAGSFLLLGCNNGSIYYIGLSRRFRFVNEYNIQYWRSI